MSKKIAEGAGGLVLDVKVGSGAFMKTFERARELATALVGIGGQHAVPVSALLTDMTVPLGHAVGNAVEVAESVEVLKGGGPADVVALTIALAREMLALAGLSDVDPAAVLASGAAYETWCAMISAQGGDPDAALPKASAAHVIEAPADGVLARLDAYPVGIAAWRLGAGRARKEDPVDHAAGVLCLAKPGDSVAKGQPVFELRTNNADAIPAALEALGGAWSVADEAPERQDLVLDVLRSPR
jgi:thymidine phosphorylase